MRLVGWSRKAGCDVVGDLRNLPPSITAPFETFCLVTLVLALASVFGICSFFVLLASRLLFLEAVGVEGEVGAEQTDSE